MKFTACFVQRNISINVSHNTLNGSRKCADFTVFPGLSMRYACCMFLVRARFTFRLSRC